MTRGRAVSFPAAVSDQGIRSMKLYPEENAEARFRISRVVKPYAHCSRHSLFQAKLGEYGHAR